MKNIILKKRDRLVSKNLDFFKNNRKNDIYGNCKVYSPNGELMFLCLEKKADWYLNNVDNKSGKPLAKEINHINPVVNFFMGFFSIKPKSKKIKLLFCPKKNGNNGDKYSLSKKENRCVITGSKDLKNLTKHHITPYCYRKYFPEEYKSANSHDIVPILNSEHHNYERKADELKNEIAKIYSAPLHGVTIINHKLFYAIKSAVALVNFSENMPKNIENSHKDNIRAYTGKKNVTKKILKELSSMNYSDAKIIKSHGEIVANKIIEQGEDSIQQFVEMWRLHFLEFAEPRYMPKHWDIYRPAYRIGSK